LFKVVHAPRLTHHQREKHFTFEDPKANTGDSGSSIRSTQEWLGYIEGAKEFASTQLLLTPFSTDPTLNGLSSSTGDSESNDSSGLQPHRNILRKDPTSETDSAKGRKRFSKRHSKNGLAAVF